MRIAVLAVALLLPLPVWAAEIDVEGAVVAATLYPEGASIERLASFDAEAGRHSILIAGMPNSFDRNSLRIEGEGAFRILSIEERSASVQALEIQRQSARHAIEMEIQDLQDKRAFEANKIEAANKRLTFIDAMTSAQAAAKPNDAASLDPAQWPAMWDHIEQGAKAAFDTRNRARIEMRAIDDALQVLRAELDDTGPGRRLGPLLAVQIEADAAVSGALTLRYQMNDANWAPVYDARLSMEEAPSVTLVRRAQVRQGTGEDWTGIALTLSTARPGGRADAPDPRVLFARIEEDRPEIAMSRKVMRAPEMMADSMVMAPPPPAMVAAAPAMQVMAVAQFDGETVEYAIPGPVDIRGSGRIKQVLIDEQTDAVTLEARATPSLDETAYLYAAFENQGDGPILPGTASLYRDSVFVGTIQLARVAGGDEIDIAFGRYDSIKVTHIERGRMEGEAGLIRSRQTETRRYAMTVANLGTRSMPVSIRDSMPYAEDEDVEITLRASPMPDERDVEGRKGALAWRFTLDPGQRRDIAHGYDISYPMEQNLYLPR